MTRPNDPAADPEVERVARVLAGDEGDPDELMADGEPRWRQHVQNAIGAIHAFKVLFDRC